MLNFFKKGPKIRCLEFEHLRHPGAILHFAYKGDYNYPVDWERDVHVTGCSPQEADIIKANLKEKLEAIEKYDSEN